jgi:hypothetical protein
LEHLDFPRSGADRDLRSENKPAALRAAQAVLSAVVLDDQFAAFTEQLLAYDAPLLKPYLGLRMLI